MTEPPPTLGTIIDCPRMRANLLAIRDALADITETAHSNDGLVSATLGGRGELLEVRIQPRAFRTIDSAALAADIATTIWRAEAALGRRHRELTRTVLETNPREALR